MLTQKSAERFVVIWCHSRSVREVAAKLGRPCSYVRQVAAELVGIGVELPPLPMNSPPAPVSPARWDLVRDHLHMIPSAVRWHERRGLPGGIDVESLAVESLYKAAANFDQSRGSFPGFFRAVLAQAVLDRVRSKDVRAARGVECMPFYRAEPGPVDELVRDEELREVFRVAGVIDVGSAQGKNRCGNPNYGDLCRLAAKVGVHPHGLTRDDLLDVIASAIRARMFAVPGPN
jgi:hypothetical protein